jgi:hypothetical protein
MRNYIILLIKWIQTSKCSFCNHSVSQVCAFHSLKACFKRLVCSENDQRNDEDVDLYHSAHMFKFIYNDISDTIRLKYVDQ